MKMKLDDELRAAFEASSEFIEAPSALAHSARHRARARRRRRLAGLGACAFLLAAAGGTYAVTALPEWRASTLPAAGPRVIVRVEYPVSQMVVTNEYLYLASNQNSSLAAYDRRTGKLVRLVNVPGSPNWLSVGPGGRVWVGALDGGGQPGAVLLLDPDLANRTTDTSLDGGPVLPTSRQTALVPTQYGLLDVRMPTPGQPGRASQRLVPGTGLGPSQNTAPGVWAGMLGGRTVVQVTDGYGFHSHLVLAGQSKRTFGGATAYQAGAAASTGRDLWVAMFAVKDSNATQWGPLVSVDSQLRPTTPKFVKTSAVLAKTEDVWSSGATVWASTGAPGHALVCFSSRTQRGPVITVQAEGSVAAAAASMNTVYVTTVEGNSAETPASGPSIVTSYPVPIACR